MEGSVMKESFSTRCSGSRLIKSTISVRSNVKETGGQYVSNSCAVMEMVKKDENIVAVSNGNKEISAADTTHSNGLDSRTNKLNQIIEDVISPESRQTVMKILEQVNELSTAEKLFLYLKLPTGKSGNSDPLRQPLNPLGSRFEIHQTITWIRTHLEEDPDVSLPKQDVYDEYLTYCNTNNMKPLSTADFGKVMKQVFPCVRPRRLGTRGNSRYCYAGMRKRMKLETPQLPDLSSDPKMVVKYTEMAGNNSKLVRLDICKQPDDGGSCSEEKLVAEASCLIREWAEKLLGVKFDSLCDLACHLVQNLCVDSRSVSTFALLSTGNKVCPAGKGPTHQSAANGAAVSKHRETQLQLQRKLQEREVIREQKRKLQDQQTAVAATSKKHQPKRTKSEHKSTNISTQGDREPLQQGTICDKVKKNNERTNEKPIPDPLSLKRPLPPCSNLTSHSTNKSVAGPVATEQDSQSKSSGKLPIPRLNNVCSKSQQHQQQMHNVIILPSLPQPQAQKNKYKPIQPKPMEEDSNSQEQEESELVRYFQTSDEPDQQKLSQLRLLLERNLSQPPPTQMNQPAPSIAHASSMSSRNGRGGKAGLRRVSFETSVLEHQQQSSSVPPSPNTRRRIFSFTPISPGPHSPRAASSSANASPFVSPRNTPIPRSRHNSGQTAASYLARHKVVRSNSVNTPPQYQRTRPNLMFAIPSSEPSALPPMSPVSISAPLSPMIPFQSTTTNSSIMLEADLGQKNLLQVAQTPKSEAFMQEMMHPQIPGNTDPLAQEVSQFFADELAGISDQQSLSFRSQSVPLHHNATMSPKLHFNFLAASANNSVAATPVPSEFADFGDAASASTDLIGAEDTELNSENLSRIFNLLDDVHNAQTLSMDMRAGPSSRSYPNTPLPYSRGGDPIVASFSTSVPPASDNFATSRSYPSTPMTGLTDDFNLGARRNITALLDNPPALLDNTPATFADDVDLALDVLQDCDTFSQFVQEVNNPPGDS